LKIPAEYPGGKRARLSAFRALAADLESRIAFLASLIDTESHKEHARHG